ncbi:hypothetical protein [Humisphaera borealis]|uniref:Uncharacterized protein n=1 Tax=Humisphaera borealis TaxID=2807512 RepID=A0A7M2WVR3_9BACT|nr:hypothetical protein [Humisphaera borealis]QOV89575.1 hypothetical protein IPV69_25860 [Humisphaera borealis]
MVEAQHLKAPLDALVGRLMAAFARAPKQGGKTRYVGLLDVRSEEVGRALDATAGDLRSLISAELRAMPDVFVLERSDMGRLADESALAEIPVALRGSSTLLESGIRKEGTDLVVTIRSKSSAGAVGEERVIRGPADGLVKLRPQLVAAIARLLSIAPPVVEAIDPQLEASAFSERSRQLASHGALRAAALAADVALALDPTQERRNFAYLKWRAAADANPAFEMNKGSSTYLPVDAPARYEAAIRAAVLQIASFHDLEATVAQSGDVKAPGGLEFVRTGPLHRYASAATAAGERWSLRDIFDKNLSLQFDPADEEILRQRERLRELCQMKFDRLVRICRSKNWSTSDLLAEKLYSIGRFCETDEEANRWLADCLKMHAADEWRKDLSAHAEAVFYVALASVGKKSYLPYRRPIPRVNNDLLLGSTDPKVKLAGQAVVLDSLSPGSPAQLQLAESMIRLAWEATPVDEPSTARIVAYEYFDAWDSPIKKAVEVLSRNDGGKPARRTFDALLAHSAQEGDTTRLLAHNILIRHFVYALRSDKTGSHLDALEAQLSAFPSQAFVEGNRKHYSGLITSERKSLNQPARTNFLATAFQITPVPLDGIAAPSKPHWMVAEGKDFLILCEQSQPNFVRQKWALWSVPIQGGRATAVATGEGDRWSIRAINGHAKLGDTHYFATAKGLLAGSGGKLQLLTDAQGLPVTNVTSIAVFGGRLLLGFEGGLSWYDPASRTAQAVASTKAVTIKNVLDGGLKYTISSLVADSTRKCIWVGVTGGERHGVFQFLSDGTLNRVVKAQDYSGGQLNVDGDRLLFVSHSGIVGYRFASRDLDPPIKVQLYGRNSAASGVQWLMLNETTVLTYEQWAGPTRTYSDYVGPLIRVEGRVYFAAPRNRFASSTTILGIVDVAKAGAP